MNSVPLPSYSIIEELSSKLEHLKKVVLQFYFFLKVKLCVYSK